MARLEAIEEWKAARIKQPEGEHQQESESRVEQAADDVQGGEQSCSEGEVRASTGKDSPQGRAADDNASGSSTGRADDNASGSSTGRAEHSPQGRADDNASGSSTGQDHPPRTMKEEDLPPDLKQPVDRNIFKRILLNQCQASFEQHLKPPDVKAGAPDSYEALVKYKTKMLGNIKLVGELIRAKMIATRIAKCVCDDLLCEDNLATNERLETLAVFVETVGPVLDNEGWQYYGHFLGTMKVGQPGNGCRVWKSTTSLLGFLLFQ